MERCRVAQSTAPLLDSTLQRFKKGFDPVPPNGIGHHSGRLSISSSKYSGYLNRVSFPYRVTVRPGTSACSCSTTW